MGAPAALLGYLHVLIVIDHSVGTGIQTVLLSCAFGWIDDYCPIFSLVDGITLAGFHAGSIIAVLAHVMHIGHLDLGHLSSDMLFYPGPELAGVRLGFGNRSPIIAYMLILAGYLAVIAAVAFGDIDDHYFSHLLISFREYSLKFLTGTFIIGPGKGFRILLP